MAVHAHYESDVLLLSLFGTVFHKVIASREYSTAMFPMAISSVEIDIFYAAYVFHSYSINYTTLSAARVPFQLSPLRTN